MLPLVLPYDNFYRSFSWFLDIVYPELFRPDQARLSGMLVNDEYTKVKHPNSTQSGASGCLVASKRHRKRQTPKLSKNCEAISAWHLTQTGEVELMFVIWQLKPDKFEHSSQRQHRSGEMIPAWTGPAKSCWCWTATEREATKSGPFQTPPCFTGSITLYKSCVQLFPMLPSTKFHQLFSLPCPAQAAAWQVLEGRGVWQSENAMAGQDRFGSGRRFKNLRFEKSWDPSHPSIHLWNWINLRDLRRHLDNIQWSKIN